LAIWLSITEGPPVSDGLAVGGAHAADGEPPGFAWMPIQPPQAITNGCGGSPGRSDLVFQVFRECAF
jgi:hypothetical protein